MHKHKQQTKNAQEQGHCKILVVQDTNLDQQIEVQIPLLYNNENNKDTAI